MQRFTHGDATHTEPVDQLRLTRQAVSRCHATGRQTATQVRLDGARLRFA
jgi:hypothetical protein